MEVGRFCENSESLSIRDEMKNISINREAERFYSVSIINSSCNDGKVIGHDSVMWGIVHLRYPCCGARSCKRQSLEKASSVLLSLPSRCAR